MFVNCISCWHWSYVSLLLVLTILKNYLSDHDGNDNDENAENDGD